MPTAKVGYESRGRAQQRNEKCLKRKQSTISESIDDERRSCTALVQKRNLITYEPASVHQFSPFRRSMGTILRRTRSLTRTISLTGLQRVSPCVSSATTRKTPPLCTECHFLSITRLFTKKNVYFISETLLNKYTGILGLVQYVLYIVFCRGLPLQCCHCLSF